MSEKVVKTDAEWKKLLSSLQYRVMRKKGTERAFTGKYHDFKDKGKYVEEQDPSYIDIRLRSNTEVGNPWGLYMTLDEYKEQPDTLFIYADEITDDERSGDLPRQGYVWID